MNKFKKGDQVKYITLDPSDKDQSKVGKIGTIKDATPNGYWIQFFDFPRYTDRFLREVYLELAESVFKKGAFIELIHLDRAHQEGTNVSKEACLHLGVPYQIFELSELSAAGERWIQLEKYGHWHHPSKFRLYDGYELTEQEPEKEHSPLITKEELESKGWNWISFIKL